MPSLELEGEFTGAKSKNVIDTFNVVSTKSTILKDIYKSAKSTSNQGVFTVPTTVQ